VGLLKEYIVEEKLVHKLKLVVPTDKRREIYDQLEAEGFFGIRRNPYTDENLFPKVDVTRTIIYAEKEMEIDPGEGFTR
jgi:hypothetical protein